MKDLDIQLKERLNYEDDGDAHAMTSVETPLRADAFLKSDSEKINNIEKLFGEIMLELGLDPK